MGYFIISQHVNHYVKIICPVCFQNIELGLQNQMGVGYYLHHSLKQYGQDVGISPEGDPLVCYPNVLSSLNPFTIPYYPL